MTPYDLEYARRLLPGYGRQDMDEEHFMKLLNYCLMYGKESTFAVDGRGGHHVCSLDHVEGAGRYAVICFLDNRRFKIRVTKDDMPDHVRVCTDAGSIVMF